MTRFGIRDDANVLDAQRFGNQPADLIERRLSTGSKPGENARQCGQLLPTRQHRSGGCLRLEGGGRRLVYWHRYDCRGAFREAPDGSIEPESL